MRHEAGLAVGDLMRARGGGEEGAFAAADDAWRVENGNACLLPDPDESDACELRREMDRAALYLGRAVELPKVPAPWWPLAPPSAASAAPPATSPAARRSPQLGSARPASTKAPVDRRGAA